MNPECIYRVDNKQKDQIYQGNRGFLSGLVRCDSLGQNPRERPENVPGHIVRSSLKAAGQNNLESSESL